MKKIFLLGLLITATLFLCAQRVDYIINLDEVERIEKTLASDEMQGRRVYGAGIEKAADFIESEFKSMGLRTYDANDKFFQSFIMVRPRFISASANIDGKDFNVNKLVVITTQADLRVDAQSGYLVHEIGADENLFEAASRHMETRQNKLVVVHEKHARDFSRLSSFGSSLARSNKNVVFLLSDKKPSVFAIEAKHEINEQKLANVVGVLPGKSRRNEWVVFSAHYDHLGIGTPVQGDSIFNGANDNAAGVTALLMLARYFRDVRENERTLVFAAFTAEEIGLFGSQYFASQLDPDKVVANINIEMIGTTSKWGKNSAFITGYQHSDLGAMLQKNLEGTAFRFYPDPYPHMDLFEQSDNFSLARLGVPAHTISTAKIDEDPHYHKVSDEVKTLDLENMVMVIRSIALSAKGLIAGKETPTRIINER